MNMLTGVPSQDGLMCRALGSARFTGSDNREVRDKLSFPNGNDPESTVFPILEKLPLFLL